MLGKIRRKQYIINEYIIEERKNLELKLNKDLFVKKRSNTSLIQFLKQNINIFLKRFIQIYETNYLIIKIYKKKQLI